MPRGANASRQQQAFEALLDEDFQDDAAPARPARPAPRRRGSRGGARRQASGGGGGFRLRCDVERQSALADERAADLERLQACKTGYALHALRFCLPPGQCRHGAGKAGRQGTCAACCSHSRVGRGGDLRCTLPLTDRRPVAGALRRRLRAGHAGGGVRRRRRIARRRARGAAGDGRGQRRGRGCRWATARL
jgi:hypothetical protein